MWIADQPEQMHKTVLKKISLSAMVFLMGLILWAYVENANGHFNGEQAKPDGPVFEPGSKIMLLYSERGS